MKCRTYISSKLFTVEPEVLSKQSWVASFGVAEKDVHVLLKEFRKILSVEVVEELEEKKEGLSELVEGGCWRKLVGGEGEEVVGSL
jgi:hypothetical protein